MNGQSRAAASSFLFFPASHSHAEIMTRWPPSPPSARGAALPPPMQLNEHICLRSNSSVAAQGTHFLSITLIENGANRQHMTFITFPFRPVLFQSFGTIINGSNKVVSTYYNYTIAIFLSIGCLMEISPIVLHGVIPVPPTANWKEQICTTFRCVPRQAGQGRRRWATT